MAKHKRSWSASTQLATPQRLLPRALQSAQPSSRPLHSLLRSSKLQAAELVNQSRKPQRRCLQGSRTLPSTLRIQRSLLVFLIGGAVPFLFSALAIRAVGRTAGVVVQEVRKQFADGKIMRRRQRSQSTDQSLTSVQKHHLRELA